MPELRSYDRTREAWHVDNFFWHLERYFEALDIDEEKVHWTVVNQVELIFNRLDDLEVDSRLTVLERKANVFAEELDDLIKERRYFEALDIDDEKEKVQMVVMYLNDIATLRWRRHYTDECDVKKTWEKFKHELKRQLYLESIKDMSMINLRRLRQKGRICEYVKEYSALMLEIPEMSERQRLCFFIDRLQYWVAKELRRREPRDLASAMMIVERLGDFKQFERLRSPRHERAKGRGDDRSKNGSPKATDNEWNGDEGRCRHYKREKKHEGNRKQGDSRDYKAHGGPRGGCFYGAGPHCGRYFPHKEVIKNVDLRIGEWTGKKDFNIIDMDELGVVLGMDFMEKSSAMLNPYCVVMMMAGKKGQPKWMIPLVSKDGANTRKGITVLQLDEGLKLCYVEWQMGPRTYALLDMVEQNELNRSLLALLDENISNANKGNQAQWRFASAVVFGSMGKV
ncbi:hypothetical protein RJ639_011072 [Escallonia herrerae]|uniref:Ty3 transposon capsid-like protein domain-containing protein n=1 Tax=Escallonia herrerae TaxID=1293975 RepID=A0AA88VMQ8_9ASTE|nr:hypothetical protein RJ639_011072 [Escallonia herrerae]